jgi:hypothetical protein
LGEAVAVGAFAAVLHTAADAQLALERARERFEPLSRAKTARRGSGSGRRGDGGQGGGIAMLLMAQRELAPSWAASARSSGQWPMPEGSAAAGAALGDDPSRLAIVWLPPPPAERQAPHGPASRAHGGGAQPRSSPWVGAAVCAALGCVRSTALTPAPSPMDDVTTSAQPCALALLLANYLPATPAATAAVDAPTMQAARAGALVGERAAQPPPPPRVLVIVSAEHVGRSGCAPAVRVLRQLLRPPASAGMRQMPDGLASDRPGVTERAASSGRAAPAVFELRLYR